MADVSCKIIIDLLEYANQRGFSAPSILKESPELITFKDLQNPDNYASWDLFCQICSNISQSFGNDSWAKDYAYSTFKRNSLHFEIIRKAAGIIGGVKILYWAAQKWGAPRNFKNVNWNYENLSSNKIRLTATISSSFRDFPLVMLIGKYNFEKMPLLLGLPEAKVDLELRPHVGIYSIDL